jgi:hypothetical protein
LAPVLDRFLPDSYEKLRRGRLARTHCGDRARCATPRIDRSLIRGARSRAERRRVRPWARRTR